MSFTVTVTKRGGVFTPGASFTVERFHEEALMDAATAGAAMVRQRLHTVLRNPTGYYSSQIRERRTAVGSEVTDSGVVYGPWLEGISSRNASTRFKGYATFRRTAQDLDKQAPRIVDPTITQLVARLN